MPSTWITERRVKDGAVRYRVMFRDGGRDGAPRYGGSFRTMREARLRRQVILGELALRHSPAIANSVCVTEYNGMRIGRVWRLKYREPDGRQVQTTLGRQIDGYTRDLAEEAAARFLLSQQANPLNPLLALVDTLIGRQERELGEALPHLYVAQTQIRQLHRLASTELAITPGVFDEQEHVA